MIPARLFLALLATSACTLPPSPLGMLPGSESGAGDSTGTTAASPTTTPTTTAPDPPTSTSESTAPEPTSDTDAPPGSAWQDYCEYINRHGGRCDPAVDLAPDLTWPGRGFIVHEWGTDTVVVAADGSPQRGLHHEEEDLPDFVHDRILAGSLAGSVSVHVKLETPVTYFYSDTARTATVSVGFPAGVFTQWFPPVAGFSPWIAAPGAIPKLQEYSDPALDPFLPFASDACRQQYAVIADGQLDWGDIEVLARGETEPLLAAPIDQYTWAHARDVDANLLRVAGVPGAEAPLHERFLFYRGLGNFPLPMKISAAAGGLLTLHNDASAALARVFVVNVDAERGAFVEWSDGLGPQQMLADAAPSLAPAPPHDLFAAALAERIVDALDAAGLYHDEALAMVATWQRQWFRSPGLRVLYLVPQAWTDASIPLTVAPTPDASVRVMLIRSEVLTPEQEQVDVAAAEQLADPDTAAAGAQHFLALGRFAEPRLRRAAQLLGEPAYLADLLTQLLHADTRVAAGE